MKEVPKKTWAAILIIAALLIHPSSMVLVGPLLEALGESPFSEPLRPHPDPKGDECTDCIALLNASKR